MMVRIHLPILSVLAAALLVGCATGGSKSSTSTDSANQAAAKSVYLEGVSALQASRAGSERCLTSSAEFKGKTWKQLVKHANGCAKNGDWKNLEVTAQEIARVEINSPWGAYFHSLVAEKGGDLPRALWMIELAMKKAPGAALFHYQKGRVLWGLKNYKGAVEEIRIATTRDSKLVDGHVFLAQVFHRDHEVDKAARHYEAVLALDARHRPSLEGLADIRMTQGKFANAVELLTAAVSVSSSDLRTRIKLAQAHEAIEGNLEQALTNYRAARDLQTRGKESGGLEFDIGEKIKLLEARVASARAENPRSPAQTKGGGK